MSPTSNQPTLNWRYLAALYLFSSALLGFILGVSVSEKPPMGSGDLLIMAYYSLSLFVIGGVDLGTPVGGPPIARALVWIAYFGAPLLAASTLMDTLIRAFTPQAWELRRLRNHIIVVGAGELTLSYLRVLRKKNKRITVVVVCRAIEQSAEDELRHKFGAIVIIGDITHEYFLRQLKIDRAKKILLFGADSLRNYEAASIISQQVPNLGNKVVIHCDNLRFMRSMMSTRVAKECQTFNTYHLAATSLVQSHLLNHFQTTKPKDVVILAGFGRFGQIILEELQRLAPDEMATVVIIDNDAHRRIMVADEQTSFKGQYQRFLIEGDISHPEVWTKVRQTVKAPNGDPVIVLGTGREEENLRTALWIRHHRPHAKIFARTSMESKFAEEVSNDHGIVNVSIMQLVEDNIPTDWVAFG